MTGLHTAIALHEKPGVVSVTPGGSKRVLIVDDDQELLRLVEHWLTAAGYSVVACDRFEAAKQQLQIGPPAVLVTDVRLGAFNGLQLVILAKELWPQTTLLVMSGFDDPALRKEALQCGASYLPKPFTKEEFLATLDAAQVA